VGFTILGVILLSVLLLRTAKKEQRTVLFVLGLFLLCIVGLLIAAALDADGLGLPAGYLRSLCIFGEGMCIICLIGTAVFRALLPAMRVNSPRILQDVVAAVAYIVWGMVWLHANHVNVTGLIATSAVITAVIGFSLQDTLGNILGGVTIHLDQSVQVGDWLQVGDRVGKVVEVRWRYTALETRNWETVIIPNSALVKDRFLVLGRRHGEPVQWRRSIAFQVDFAFSPLDVIETAESGLRAAEIPNVAEKPAPRCILDNFGDSSSSYTLWYWLTDLAVDLPTDSEVRTHLYFALKRAGVSLSLPAQQVYLAQESAEQTASREEEFLAQRVEVLRHVDLFDGLKLAELQRLATRLTPSPFPRGAIMTQQGTEADWLYILYEGKAEVILEDGHGHRTKVAELGPSSFFGEMGLMTGEPRSATVVARTPVECYRLDKDAFHEILKQRPEVASEISTVLASRRVQLDAAREDLDAEAHERRLSSARVDILDRIRSFFGMDP
jgi:small-conductance mechanosensitive channel/CRP-like cAMP-binding protein